MVTTAPPRGEVGHASVSPWSAFINNDETAPQLTWPASVNTYHKMRTDAQVDALTKAITLPIRRLRWVIDPNGARDEVVEQIAADLGLPIRGVEESTKRGRRRFNYDDFLRHSILGLWYGHMFFEQVGDIDDDLAWRLRKLAPRMPQSLSEIKAADDGGLDYIKQYDPKSYQGKKLSVNRLVAFVWEREGANWLGRSMLRPLYRHWLLKDRLLRIDTIKHERFGVGIPTGRAPEGGNPQHYADMARAIRATEDGGVGLPAGADVGVEGIRGSLPDTMASVIYHDEAMARSFMAMVVQLGQTQTGSRALGETFASFFQMAVDAIADWHAGVASEHVIEDIVDWNWGEDEQAPLIGWERPEESDLAVGDLVSLIDKGVLQIDHELEAWIRDRHKLPPRLETMEEEKDTRQAADSYTKVGLPALVESGIITRDEARQLIGVSGPAPSPEEIAAFLGALNNGQNGEVAARSVAARVAASPPYTMRDDHPDCNGWAVVKDDSKNEIVPGGCHDTKKDAENHLAALESNVDDATAARAAKQTADDARIGHRDPLDHEVQAATDFTALQTAWQDDTSTLITEWRVIRAIQINDLVGDIEEVAAAGDVAAMARITTEAIGEEILIQYMMGIAERAIAGARAEAAAQGAIIPLIDTEVVAPAIRAQAQAVASLNARGISEAAARQAVQRYGSGEGVDPADIAAGVREHLEDLSDAFLVDQLGGALTMAQNAGRLAVMEEGAADRIYASELLDQNTCVNCSAVDGREYSSIEDAIKDYPSGGHKDCLGGPRCRGTLVGIYGEEASTT